MKRLYTQIYLTIVASLVLVVAVLGVLWRVAGDAPPRQMFDIAGTLAVAGIPEPDAPLADQQRALERLSHRLHTDVTLFGPEGVPIAAAGRPIVPPQRLGDGGGWYRGTWVAPLPDGRWLVARMRRHHQMGDLPLAALLGGVALILALAAVPLARRLTRRLERLQAGVESLGAGELSARVQVEGRDEVARLAASFNRAAERIEGLVGAHRMLLANASHELRTPLARIRMGVELLQERADQKRRGELETDIAELDQLIDEILLASRLDTVAHPEVSEEVDLLALAAEECARYDACTLDGDPVLVRGDPRLLRRLVRNLLENAHRHGEPPVEVEVRRRDGKVALSVCDHGPGIPEGERDAVFSPFHRTGGGAKSGGTGLGLALVRQIARQHSGVAAYAPRPDRASCFVVTLPEAPRG
jgi:signal transduction histidine kinase